MVVWQLLQSVVWCLKRLLRLNSTYRLKKKKKWEKEITTGCSRYEISRQCACFLVIEYLSTEITTSTTASCLFACKRSQTRLHRKYPILLWTDGFDETRKFKREVKSNSNERKYRWSLRDWTSSGGKLTNCEHDWEWHIRNWIISQFNLRDLVLSASIRVSASSLLLLLLLPDEIPSVVFVRNGLYGATPWPKIISVHSLARLLSPTETQKLFAA